MKATSFWSLILTLALFASCKPEAPDFSSCERALQPSSLNATDRAVIQVLLNEHWYNFILSETIEADFDHLQNTGWNIHPTTISNANTRNQSAGFIGENDFEEDGTITQFEYNCIGNTLNLENGQSLQYLQFSLPGYNNDSTEALIRVENGSWQWFNSSCDILLRKRNGFWQREVNLCAVQ